MTIKERARNLIDDFKKGTYVYGLGVLDQVGALAKEFGNRALLLGNLSTSLEGINQKVRASLESAGITLVGDGIYPNARPNAPREDIYRLEATILRNKPEVIVVVGGGSSIDAAKASAMMAVLADTVPNEDIEGFFGVGKVTEARNASERRLIPVIAVQTASSSGAHLTKYSNITDPVAGQKKLIVDEAVVPPRALFDYAVTATSPEGLTVDGALDGLSHCLEVFFGADEKNFPILQEITAAAFELVVANAPALIKDPGNLDAREAVGLATDLGAYAIMIGGTNGAHLTSFSLVDVTTHGRACGLMNPYYTVFFAPAIERQLRVVGGIFKNHGFIPEDIDAIKGRDLGEAVARGMISFSRSLGSPTTLNELPDFTEGHIDRALKAAKNPQLKMKLQNMPVPLTAELVDEYMGPILAAAKTGELSLIRSM